MTDYSESGNTPRPGVPRRYHRYNSAHADVCVLIDPAKKPEEIREMLQELVAVIERSMTWDPTMLIVDAHYEIQQAEDNIPF